MNFLELAQETRRGVGMQGSGPSAIVGASQSEQDVIDSVRDAWIDIQNFRQKWQWMRTTGSFQTVQSQSTYTLAQIFGPGYRFKNWIKNTLYANVNNKWQGVRFVEYDSFIRMQKNNTQEGHPSVYTIVPWNNSLMFNLPNAIYPINVDYYKSPQRLEAASEVPECPEYYHIAIKYHAIEKFSTTVVVPEKQQEAAQNYAVIIGQMMRDQIHKERVVLWGIA